MTKGWVRRGLMVGIGVAVGWPARADEPKATGEPARPAAAPDPALAERLAAVRREFDAQMQATRRAQEAAKSEAEGMAIYERMAPDDAAFSRRLVDLVLTNPADPASRDALIWVINKPGHLDVGPYGDEFGRAAALLVRHHADDPIAASVAFGLDNAPSTRRDALLFNLLASAQSREAKGMARLALGRYLDRKADLSEATRKDRKRATWTYEGPADADGKSSDRQMLEPLEMYAERLATGQCDPAALRAEAERLYREVVADYADVANQTLRRREWAALLADPDARWNDQPLTAEDRQQLAALLARNRTLGEVAGGYLDERSNVTEGKPAPLVEGTDADGKPLRLADHRGKVVALIFWGSWCGPCMGQVPHEREVAAKYRDRPVALIGVNCRETPEAARKAILDNGMTWPHFIDGTAGPIVAQYHVEHYPTIVVIDAAGTLRSKDATGEALDKEIDKLLAEMGSAKAPAPAGAKSPDPTDDPSPHR